MKQATRITYPNSDDPGFGEAISNKQSKSQTVTEDEQTLRAIQAEIAPIRYFYITQHSKLYFNDNIHSKINILKSKVYRFTRIGLR